MLPSILVYCGCVLALLAIICLVKPLRLLHIHSRRRALLVLAFGMVLVLIAFNAPIRIVQVQQPRTELDRYAPLYQFNELHSTRIKAPASLVYRAINEVTAEEIPLFRSLTWIRRGGRSGHESILDPKPGSPLLATAIRTGFIPLADNPGREVVFGVTNLSPRDFQPQRSVTPDDFIRSRQPGLGFAVMNFQIDSISSGECLLTTETRVYATDPVSARKFQRYWSVVYPGSSLIRYGWLHAIKKRAERG